MASTSNSVEFKLVGRDQTKAAIDQAIRNLENVGKKTETVNVSMRSLTRAWVAFGAAGKAFEAVKSIADFTIKVEQAQAGFQTLLGSATLAEERIRSLTKFAADTPFGMEGVVEVNRMLQSLTDGALSTAEGMQLVGDAAAATGRPLQEVGMWVGRLYAGLESGTPVGEATLRLVEMGLVSGKVKRELDALAVSGALPANEAMEKLHETFGFATGAMDLQAQTLGGLITKIKDYALIAASGSDTVMGIAKATKDFLKDIVLIQDHGFKTDANPAREAFVEVRNAAREALQESRISMIEFETIMMHLNDQLANEFEPGIRAVGREFGVLSDEAYKAKDAIAEQMKAFEANKGLYEKTMSLFEKMGNEMLSAEERKQDKIISSTVALTEQAEKLHKLKAIGDDTYETLIRRAAQYHQTQMDALNKAPAFESAGMGQFAEEDAFIANIEASLERAKELEQEYFQFESDNLLSMRDAERVAYNERMDEIMGLQIAELEKNELIYQAQVMHSERMLAIEKKEQAERKRIQTMNARYAQATFANMANAAATFMGEGSAAYKAFASVEATIATYLAANKAFAEVPYPFNFVASAAVIAAGLANVAKINGAGAGGRAHSGATNIPNEGTYLLNRGERVLAPEQNRDLTEALEKGGIGGGQTQIVIDGEVLATTLMQMANDGRFTIPARAVA